MDTKESEYNQINQLYDECLNYLKSVKNDVKNLLSFKSDPNIDFIKEIPEYASLQQLREINYQIENELRKSYEDVPHYEEIPNLNSNCEDDYDDVNDDINDKQTSQGNQTNEQNRERYNGMLSNSGIYEEIPKIQTNSIQNSDNSVNEIRSERLRKLSSQLPKIIITQSNTSLNKNKIDRSQFKNYSADALMKENIKEEKPPMIAVKNYSPRPHRPKVGYGDYPKRLVSKSGIENVALISNVPFERIRLLNDTFHTLINLRWRWIVSGTIVVHFTIWLVFAIFWYITALAHYDFEPNPPKKSCVTGGKDFVTIFLASVEAQTTIGFGDRTIDEECPESIFLFIMQLILGTGLSGVLTCVVYAKLTRPEKLSRDGVGFSKKAVISLRDGKLCLMIRAWDLNYDHIISSEFSAHFVKTYRTKEGETIRYYARRIRLQQRQFLLWPVTLVHEIDSTSPFYDMTPSDFAELSYEITVNLKGASASMGTFTQSQTSYLPKEILWGYRFPCVVRYEHRKQKYVIDHKKLDAVELFDTPLCSARHLENVTQDQSEFAPPGTPSSFSEKISTFQLGKTSSFRRNHNSKV